MELSGQTVVVVGLGKSGRAAARLARHLGAEVIATDNRPLECLDDEVRSLDARLVVGGHDAVPFDSADRIVVSPGVPRLPILERAAARGPVRKPPRGAGYSTRVPRSGNRVRPRLPQRWQFQGA